MIGALQQICCHQSDAIDYMPYENINVKIDLEQVVVNVLHIRWNHPIFLATC